MLLGLPLILTRRPVTARQQPAPICAPVPNPHHFDPVLVLNHHAEVETPADIQPREQCCALFRLCQVCVKSSVSGAHQLPGQ